MSGSEFTKYSHNVDIVNIVGVGDFNKELDLGSLSNDLEIHSIQHNPETFPGLKMKLTSEEGVVLLYSSGSFIINGVDTENKLISIFDKVRKEMESLETGITTDVEPPKIRNMVCSTDLGIRLDLAKLSLHLGMNWTEYEPEQSSFLYYWPEKHNCLITIPSNGKAAVTGVQQIQEAEQALNDLRRKIDRQDELVIHTRKTDCGHNDE